VFFFKSGEAKLKADSLVAFNKFYRKFEKCTQCTFELKGFADSVGNSDANIRLSQKRINYVKTLLTGTSPKQIRELPFGEKLSQSSKLQHYRKVILFVKSTKISAPVENKTTISLSKADTLTPAQKRIREFDQRNRPVRLNILFQVNTTNLTYDSRDDLDLLVQYMTDNPQLKIKLDGHVCCDHNDYILSRNRAVEVMRYLTQRKIDAKRISVEGHGNTKPLVEEIDAATEQVNRRVEVTFLSE
jgi:outer membrane protein OmpA-like peptidoglycan-associated protein